MKGRIETSTGLPQETIDYVKENYIDKKIAYHRLAMGGGIQSSTLWLMNMMGLIEPRAEFAVFADTGYERKATYEYLDYLDSQAIKYGAPPIMRVITGNIRSDNLTPLEKGGHVSIPFYVNSGKKRGVGRLNRQCTTMYKLEPINREVKKIFGWGKKTVEWIGFSLDEIHRRNDNHKKAAKYKKKRYPLLEIRMTRDDCLTWLQENGHPLPIKSCCIGCPFMNMREIAAMKERSPKEFQDRIDFDTEMRGKKSKKKATEEQLVFIDTGNEPTYDLFLDKNLIPQKDLNFDDIDSEKHDPMEEDCEGGCHL